jgi:hypothetical protein
MSEIFPIPLEWKWPVEENEDWEWDEDDVDTSAETLAAMMMHMWISNCQQKPTKALNPRKKWIPEIKFQFRDRQAVMTDIFPSSNAPIRWLRNVVSVKIYFPDRNLEQGQYSILT